MFQPASRQCRAYFVSSSVRHQQFQYHHFLKQSQPKERRSFIVQQLTAVTGARVYWCCSPRDEATDGFAKQKQITHTNKELCRRASGPQLRTAAAAAAAYCARSCCWRKFTPCQREESPRPSATILPQRRGLIRKLHSLAQYFAK